MTSNAINRLRHRVVIQQPQRTADEGGVATLSWSALATVWAEITGRPGREILLRDQLSSRGTYRVVMRYRSDVDATMRLVWRDRVFEVLSVRDEDGTQRWLTCECEERGP